MEFKDEALSQINTTYPGFDTNLDDFKALEQLNYLMFFQINAVTSLELAEKYNQNQNISNNEQVAITHSLFRDAIMNYAKCFTVAEAHKLKIDINAVIKEFAIEDKKEFKEMHDHMIDIRHKYIAHNLTNEYEFSIVATKLESGRLIVKPTYTIKTPINDFKRFQKQCFLIQNYLINRTHKVLAKIKDKTGLELDFG